MKRTPLSIGSTVQAKGGSSYTYIIDRVIGDGASSVVYEAHYIDSAYGRHDVRLKECYPYASDIQRLGTELVWAAAETATNDKVAFSTAYHKLLDFQNTTKLRNSTAHIFDLLEANGTLYSVMDVNEGKTFEQDDSEKLSDILKTTLALARVVEKYHNNGYLHLDIKPSNFLIIPETRELVILFDVDSVISMEDISSGKVKCVSYSKEWAAPEQMQGRVDKLCPATDIYSIGAILFQKVMGRAVENEDIGIFADWDFDGEVFDRVNPKIKRLLREILKKTLAANVKRRYQSVDILIDALEASVECVRDGAPYLITDCPTANKNFLGRDKELEHIVSSFESGARNIFLHGFGGIGKSELAKKYAYIHSKEYDAILFLSYEDSLEELLDDIEIQNCNAEGSSEKLKVLKKIFCNQRVLLIVDNFDVEIDGDDYLDKFLRLKVDKIFTTRTDFSDLADSATVQIEIENLTAEALVSLFEKESELVFSDLDYEIIKEILKTFNYYTLLVPILAKQLISSGWSLETLKEKVTQGLRAFEDTEKVAIAKDGRIYRKTGLDMMRATFRMVGLTDIQRRVLINLYFLRFVKLNKEEYRKYLWKENDQRVKHIDAINDLINRKWIDVKSQKDYVKLGQLPPSDPEILIHPIIVEMIEIELQPNIATSDISAYVQFYLPWTELGAHLIEGIDDWGPLYQDTIANKLNWLCLLGFSLNLEDEHNLNYVVDNLFKIVNGNIYIIELIQELILNKLLAKLLPYLNNLDTKFDTRFKIANLFEVKWLAQLRYGYFGDNQEALEQEAKRTSHKYFMIANQFSANISSNIKNNAIILLCKPVYQVLRTSYGIFKTKIPNDVCDIVKEYEPIWENAWEDDEYIDWDVVECDDKVKHLTAKALKPTDGDLLDKSKDEESYYIKKFSLGYSIDDIIGELVEDDRFDIEEKATIFDDMIDSYCLRKIEQFYSYEDSKACYEYRDFLETINWSRVLLLSEKYLDYCQRNNIESLDIDFEIYTATKYIAVAEAFLGRTTKIINKINIITQNTIEDIKEFPLSDIIEWKNFTQFWDIREIDRATFSGIGYYSHLLRNLRMCNLVLPSLICCASTLEQKIKCNYEMIQHLISEKKRPAFCKDELTYYVGDTQDPYGLLYNWYRTIAGFALNSAVEVGVRTPEGMKFFDQYTEYSEKLKAILSGTDGKISTNDLKIPYFKYYFRHNNMTEINVSDVCVDYYTQCYFDGMNIDELNRYIFTDDRLTDLGILSICKKIANEIFDEIDHCWFANGAGILGVRAYVKSIDWTRLKQLLLFEEDYYLSKNSFLDEDDAHTLNHQCDMYRALVCAVLDDSTLFNTYMKYLFDEYKSLCNESNDFYFWYTRTEFANIRMADPYECYFAKTLETLCDLEKAELALPWAIDCAEYIHECIKTIPNYSELLMYNWYKVITEIAFAVSDDGGAYFKYQSKIDEMSNKDYEIKDIDVE